MNILIVNYLLFFFQESAKTTTNSVVEGTANNIQFSLPTLIITGLTLVVSNFFTVKLALQKLSGKQDVAKKEIDHINEKFKTFSDSIEKQNKESSDRYEKQMDEIKEELRDLRRFNNSRPCKDDFRDV